MVTKVRGSVWDSADNKLAVNVKDFGAKGNGSDNDYSAFLAANAAAAGGILYVPAGTYLIGTNLTFNCDRILFDGGVIKPDSGVTLTIGAFLDAGRSQCFDISSAGTSSIVADSSASSKVNEEVFPEWWGCTQEDTTGAINTSPMQACFNFGKTVVFNTIFRVNAPLTWKGQKFVGTKGWLTACGLKWVLGTISANTDLLSPEGDGYMAEFDHVYFEIDETSTPGSAGYQVRLLSIVGARFVKVSYCRFVARSVTMTGTIWTGIYYEASGTWYPYDQWIKGCLFDDCDYGIYAKGDVTNFAIGFIITENWFGGNGRNNSANIFLLNSTAFRIYGNIFVATGVNAGIGQYNVFITGAGSNNIKISNNHFDIGRNNYRRILIQGSVTNSKSIVIEEVDIGALEVYEESTGVRVSIYDTEWHTTYWTPTNNVGGTPTVTGRWKRRGTLIDFYINIGATGTSTATGGVTTISEFPRDQAGSQIYPTRSIPCLCAGRVLYSGGTPVTESMASIDAPNQRIYLPTFSSTLDVNVSGSYEIF